MNRNKYLMKNASIFAIGEFGSKIINFFLVPLYTYILSTEEYGTIDLIFTVGAIAIPIIMFNIGEAIMRYCLDSKVNHDEVLSIALVVIIFGFIICVFLIPILSEITLFEGYSIYIYFYITLNAAKGVTTSYLRGKELLAQYVFCNILNTFLTAIFNIYFLVVLDMGIKGYLIAYILADFFTIINAVIFGKQLRIIYYFKINTNLAKKMVFFSLAVIPNSLLWWGINFSDRIMVSIVSGTSENGILAVAYKLPSLLTTINTILMQAWKYSAIHEKDSLDRDEYANSMLDQFFRGSLMISASMLLVIRPVTKILFADSYYVSWRSSIFLLIGFVFMGISTFVGTIYYVEKKMVGNMLSALVGAVVNVVFNIALIPCMGAVGATIAACISYFVILIYRYYDTKKYQILFLFRKDYVLMYLLLVVEVIGNFLSLYNRVIVLGGAYLILLLLNYQYIKNILCKSKIIFCSKLNKKKY